MSDIDAPDPKTLDLKTVLAGRTYATETVPVFFDEALMYEYAKVAQEADYDPANKEKQRARDEMLKTFEGICFKVTVRSVPLEEEEKIIEKLIEEFPPRFGPFGNELPDREATDKMNVQLWALHVVKVEAPDGSFTVPDESDIQALRKTAPRATLEVIAQAIKDLNEKTRSGYDTIVKDPDFLSRRSLTV